jgi:hypothetical protein
MHLVGIREQSRLLVDDQCVVLPAIPAAEYDLHEFVGAVVARVVSEMHLAAHVLRFTVVDRRHNVPCRTAAQHVVNGLESARHVEWFVVGGGSRRTDAQPTRAETHRQQRRHRIHLHHAHAVRHHLTRIAAIVDVRHRQPVVEKAELELALLQHLTDLVVVRSSGEIGAALRMPPRARQRCAVLRLQETDQNHLTHRALLHHRRLTALN